MYQRNAPAIFRGKTTIFELTHMVKAIDAHSESGIMSGLPRKTFGAVKLPCKEASDTLSGRFVI